MVCSIFIASITASAWPRLTRVAGLHAMKAITLPGIGAVSRPASAACSPACAMGRPRDHRRARAANTPLARRAVDRQGRRRVAQRTSWRRRPARWPAGPALVADLQHGGAVVQALHQHHQRLARPAQVEAGGARRHAAASRRGGSRGRRLGTRASSASAGATTPAAATSGASGGWLNSTRALALDQRGVQVGGGKGAAATTRRRKATLVCRPTMWVSRSAASSRASACARSRPRR
jgi:hypothetical protein